jgi:beta-phosphoglucomutase-like phosphatase (HAD superfamily)
MINPTGIPSQSPQNPNRDPAPVASTEADEADCRALQQSMYDFKVSMLEDEVSYRKERLTGVNEDLKEVPTEGMFAKCNYNKANKETYEARKIEQQKLLDQAIAELQALKHQKPKIEICPANNSQNQSTDTRLFICDFGNGNQNLNNQSSS